MTTTRATDTISSPAPAAAGGGSTTASGAAGGPPKIDFNKFFQDFTPEELKPWVAKNIPAPAEVTGCTPERGAALASEAGLIASLVADAERVFRVVDGCRIQTHHLADPRAQTILTACQELRSGKYGDGGVDILTLADHLRRNGESGGAMAWLESNLQSSITAHAESYAASILEDYQRRTVTAALGEALQRVATDDPGAVLERLRNLEISADGGNGSLTVISGADVLGEAPPPHEPVLCGLFDRHALVEIVGPSKTRKSFAVSQLALSLAAGKPAFGFDLGGRFSVCIADLELSQADIRRRLWRMGRAIGVEAGDIEDRIRILPLAGVENVRPIIEAGAQGCDVLICDPLYALCDGGEGIEDLREPLRWLRRLAVQRVAVLFVHHDAKGTPGDRQTRDRGSGSGITGRSVDARITLTPAAADPENTIAMGFMCRSYVCPQPSAWTFTDDAFRTSDLPAEPERMADKRSREARPKMGTYNDAAVRVLREHGPMQPRLFKAKLREELRIAKHAADDLVAHLTTEGGPAMAWHTSGFPAQYFVGLVSQWESRETCGKPRESREG